MAAIRQANMTWEGTAVHGTGLLDAAMSGAFSALPVTWASRTEKADGRTSPEELLAAAHTSCYSIALSGGLARAGTPPQKLEVSAVVTFAQGEGGFKVASRALTVRGTVAGLDAASFQKAAKDGCPISQAPRGNVQLSVAATLAS